MKHISTSCGMRCAAFLLLLLCRISTAFAQSPDQLYQQATAAFDRGDISQSITLYEQALKLQPDSVPILTNLGVAYARSGRYTEAVGVYQTADKLDPSNPVVLLNLSLAWYKQGEFKQASAVLERLRSSHKENLQ
jgi:Flp pilus assembly protein TadD